MKTANTASRLKEIMDERRLRQVDILNAAKPYCEKYGIKLGRNDLSQYVSGKVEPGQEKLTILGLALNVSETWLMGYDVSPSRDVGYSSVERIDLNIRGAKKWATDVRFSEQQTNRIIEYLANLASKQKALVNCMADAEKADGKIVIDSTLQGIIDDLSYWASIAVKYVNEDLAYDDSPFSEDNIRDQYLSAIRKMSVEDQYRWLVRIQDFIDQNYPVKEENL